MKYDLPPLEEDDEEKGLYADVSFPDRWDRRVRLPVSAEIVQALKIDSGATVKLKGRVVELSSRQTSAASAQDQNFVELDMASVEVLGGNEFTEMSDED